MEEKQILKNIKSKYVLQLIFIYIGDNNLKYKLFSYSQYFQKLLNLQFSDYKMKYLNELGINLNNYLCSNFPNDNLQELYELLVEDLSKLNIDREIFEFYIINYFQEKINQYQKLNNNEIELIPYDSIDIYCPFFNNLIKTNLFSKILNINIRTDLIKQYNLMNNYISIFNKLNKSNSKYSSLTIFFRELHDIDYLKNIKINFNNIKRLTIFEIKKTYTFFEYDYLFNNLFFYINNISNNLIYLNLQFELLFVSSTKKLKNLNNLKSLKQLILENIYSTTIDFQVDLPNLIEVKLNNCINIYFSKISCLNLKKIEIIDSDPKYITFDYESLHNLKYIETNLTDFINYKNSNFETIKLNYTKFDDSKKYKEKELNVIKNILSNNKLKNIYIDIVDISLTDILKIEGYNYSVQNLKVNLRNNNYFKFLMIDKEPRNLGLFQDRFPNLVSFGLIDDIREGGKSLLNIKENKKSKINKFTCGCFNKNITFYCGSFENLISIDFNFANNFSKNFSFPLFNSQCEVIFKSLKQFKFMKNNKIDIDILYNIFNNLKKMPNLKYFYLFCIIEEKMEENDYFNFVKKLFTLKLDYIYLDIRNNENEIKEEYTMRELKGLFPYLKIKKLDSIHIKKYKNYLNICKIS